MTPDDESAELEEANARFYRAFEALDLAEMDAMWAHGEHVRCIHPGWSMLEGWEAVRQSWEAIFKDSREMRFSLGDVQARVAGDTAWVTLNENILQGSGEVAAGLHDATVAATNVFVHDERGWRLVVHHGSPVHRPIGDDEDSAGQQEAG